jgi:hypothetical protein
MSVIKATGGQGASSILKRQYTFFRTEKLQGQMGIPQNISLIKY